jgi:hypothetical protein
MDILEFLRSKKCPWTPKTFSRAVATGNIFRVQWFHENGCPWDKRSCLSAARGGHLKILRYLRENGCPWDPELTTSEAAHHKKFRSLKWILENGGWWSTWVRKNVLKEKLGDRVFLAWLRKYEEPNLGLKKFSAFWSTLAQFEL